jgi:hypothetical protein
MRPSDRPSERLVYLIDWWTLESENLRFRPHSLNDVSRVSESFPSETLRRVSFRSHRMPRIRVRALICLTHTSLPLSSIMKHIPCHHMIPFSLMTKANARHHGPDPSPVVLRLFASAYGGICIVAIAIYVSESGEVWVSATPNAFRPRSTCYRVMLRVAAATSDVTAEWFVIKERQANTTVVMGSSRLIESSYLCWHFHILELETGLAIP